MSKGWVSDAVINRMSSEQRNMLIEHIDGAVIYRRGEAWQVRQALIARGFLRGTNPQSNRPLGTVLTEAGRYALSVILGAYADALVRAGLLEPPTPLQVLRHLKASGRPDDAPVPESPENAPISWRKS